MAKAKAKAAPKKETPVANDGTITRSREEAKVPSTPKASEVEKTQSFTAAFATAAHSAADQWVGGREETTREESNAGDAGVKVTVTCK